MHSVQKKQDQAKGRLIGKGDRRWQSEEVQGCSKRGLRIKKNVFLISFKLVLVGRDCYKFGNLYYIPPKKYI